MLDYIWLDDKTPIIHQLPKVFTSVALLLHPFVQMPLEWEQDKRKNKFKHIYPSDEEILSFGKSISWSKILIDSDLKNYKELELALKTSIGALNKKYVRNDLAKKLNANLKEGIYYPAEDSTSVFLLSELLKVLASKGAHEIYFSEPLFDKNGTLKIETANPLEICNLSDKELIVTDENMDFGFFSVYDSFFTVFFANDSNINEIIASINCEAILCNNDTKINWYI